MGKKRKSIGRSGQPTPFLQNWIYGAKGAGMKRQNRKAAALRLANESRQAGVAIRNAQKEAEIRRLMKEKGLTDAQAAIEIMDRMSRR